jgi:hypothetical protein
LPVEQSQGFPFLINSSIEVSPLAFDLDVSLINSPRFCGSFQVRSYFFVDFWGVLVNPSHDGCVSQTQSSLFHHFSEISITQAVTAEPSNVQKDDLTFKMLPFEFVFRGTAHEVSLDGHIFAPQPPGTSINRITANSNTVWDKSKKSKSDIWINFSQESEHYITFEIQPGRWQFRAEYYVPCENP